MVDHQRRTFLRGLASLPLIGGSVALIGQPTASAEPVTLDLCEAYKTWLDYERRFLSWEMADLPEVVAWYGGDRVSRWKAVDAYCHYVGESGSYHPHALPPSSRAALVLSAVGCDWREDGQ